MARSRAASDAMHAGRHLHRRCELHLHRPRRVPTTRCAVAMKPAGVDHRARRVRGRRPERDDAVLPLDQQFPLVDLGWCAGGRRFGAGGSDVGIAGRERERRVAARRPRRRSGATRRPCPGTRAAPRTRPCSCPEATSRGPCRRAPVTTRHGARLAGLSLTRSRVARHRRGGALAAADRHRDAKDADSLRAATPARTDRRGRRSRADGTIIRRLCRQPPHAIRV